MHGERYIEIMVECPDCETRQKVHVSTATGGATERVDTLL
jgi:hypothetical protein